MAVNETIVTGRYFRRCTDAVNKVWQRISFWHKASDCEFDDGQTAQTKVGAIKGITTSTSVTETGYAADMITVKNLQTQIDELNSNLGASFFVVAAQTNASEAISITASMAAPKSGYYKIESCNGTWDQIYMDVQLNTNTYTYVDEGKIIGVRIIKSSGVQGRFKAKLSYKENI